jgi:GWxTD domain-containing protein
MKVFTDYKTYLSPQKGTYIEIQLQFSGAGLTYKNVKDGLQAEVILSYKITKDSSLFVQDKYRLQSPLMRDSVFDDFYEIKRFILEPGEYVLELGITDFTTPSNSVKNIQKISVSKHNTEVSLSPIQICESVTKVKEVNTLTKGEYDILPRIINYYPSESLYLPVYLEMYSKSVDSTKVYLVQNIFDTDSKEFIPSFKRSDKYYISNYIQPLIRKLNIATLPSGNYILSYGIYKEDSLVNSVSYSFVRANETNEINTENIVIDPYFKSSVTEDSLDFYLSSLLPITKYVEQNNLFELLKQQDSDKKWKYLQSYWIKSSSKPKAYEAWIRYKTQVLYVQKLYATTLLNGFETDRGRVYLQYGPPSAVNARETSPSEYPYEIWQYDKIKSFSNKRFVFYNPDLVNKNYRLLHSDMVGELKNYRWQHDLTKRNSPIQDLDNPNDGNKDHFGGESGDVFKQF